MAKPLISPHGGKLVGLLKDNGRAEELKKASLDWPDWTLTTQQLRDLELLGNGGYSPLTGFLGKKDYESVLSELRLADGTLWPLPVMLSVGVEVAQKLKAGTRLALRDSEGAMLAAVTVNEVWQPDLAKEAEAVFGSTDPTTPGVENFLEATEEWYVDGELEMLQEPIHYDYLPHRYPPAELRNRFNRLGWRRVVAYQARRPMHRAEVRMCFQASEQTAANLLIHAIADRREGLEQEHFSRLRSIQAVMNRFPRGLAMLSLLPYAIRQADLRETLLSGIVHQNYGCTHLVVNAAFTGAPNGDPDALDRHMEQLAAYREDLEIDFLPMQEMVYVPEEGRFKEAHLVGDDETAQRISNTQLVERLRLDRHIPDWFSYREVLDELRLVHRPRSRQGFTVFFTGLSGSGKSTLANALMVKLMQLGNRPVTLLDGDIVRRNLSSELGFSREHRDLNIRRIGFVASEITKNGGVALCAPIAPYDEIRQDIRRLIESVGGFILIHVSTPLEECEKRDRKGLYAKARADIIKEFTGISDPYEEPEDAELVIDTTDLSQVEATQRIMLYLEQQGYIAPEEQG